MDEVQNLLDIDLKRLGFRKSGRTYNRSVETGVIQVINFQMGAFEPPMAGPPSVPEWLKPDLYGKFAVNLGVFVDDIAKAKGDLKSTKFISEPRCSMRVRLGRLISSQNKDFWWSLDALATSITKDVRIHLFSKGADFLNRFGTRQAIVDDWLQFNETEMHLTNIARLDVGIMYAAADDRARATALFSEHLALPWIKPGHAAYVRELGSRLGLTLP